MSISRHDPDRTIVVRTFGVTFPQSRRRNVAPPSAQGWDQFIYATHGMMTVHAGDCAYAVTPHRAIHVPGPMRPVIEMHGEVALRILYLRSWTRRPGECSVVNVTPLMRELVVRAVSLGALDSAKPEQRRLFGVIRDEIGSLETAPLRLPMPRDERARRFAETGRLRHSGASRRTLERIFRRETGMSLGQWVTREKLLRAMRMLASGHSVRRTARDLGYASPSGFIAMFRRETGETPARYFAG
jgi:hypothetical protein